ncbi:MAG: septum formation initiator family protein [Verrucomicrobia bacterium]|nr:septum formation initiator family protein [Verrucomicrobiota bacterium]
MNPETGIWNKLTRIVIFLIIVAGLIVLGRWYLPLIQQNERMRREIHRLEGELEAEREQSRQLQQEMDLLTKDTAALEREVRSRLGLARPGETVIRFDAEGGTNASRQQP